MKKIITCCFLLILITTLNAQEYLSVPLDNSAYDIIEMGVLRGIIIPPPSAKPWSVNVVKKKLWEMMDDPEEVLTSKEIEMLELAYESFESKEGADILFSWESNFAVQAPDGSISSVNLAKINIRGALSDSVSWDITAMGEFLYIERDELGVPSMFPYTMSKMWDGGVFSLRNADAYFAWPEDPSLAAGLQGELSGALFGQQLQFRLGRLRRDWGVGTSGSSLFMNAQAAPFIAVEGVYSPLSWLDISFLTGVTEYYQNENQWPGQNDSFFINLLSVVQFEFNPLRFVYFSIGGSAVWLHQVNLAAFANLELRVPGLLKMWGSFFLDRLDSSIENFPVTNGNSYAYQAGIKTVVNWLPFGSFSFRYTRIEPYCYTDSYDGYGGRPLPSMSAFVSGGESLGYYMPPNSDEMLFRLEAMLLSALKAHIQFQILRHGADYGYGMVSGSSLTDKLLNTRSQKFFLEDGVYRWNNVIKLGGSYKFMVGIIPVSVYAETGYISTSFTINGDAGVGNAADYHALSDSVYRAGEGFIFSVGFRLFSR
ncbi:MAG: hypothetical protein LBC52_03785 [Treponema sp.]|jgi:hypothetical protein|nr:hypothetical protein [Treponema sp.]